MGTGSIPNKLAGDAYMLVWVPHFANHWPSIFSIEKQSAAKAHESHKWCLVLRTDIEGFCLEEKEMVGMTSCFKFF